MEQVQQFRMHHDPLITQSFMSDYNSGFTYFQDLGLNLTESILLHFKPTHDVKPSFLFLLFIIDFLLSVAF